jgi:hypothetical protein
LINIDNNFRLSKKPLSMPDSQGVADPSSPPGFFERHSTAMMMGIIALGFCLRLTALVWGQAYSYFGQGDGIEAYGTAVNYGQGEARAQYLGQPNYNAKSKLPGPFWTIFCFVSLRFWGGVQGIVLTIILLNTAVIYLTWILAKQMIGPKAALLAALFIATFPWVIYYSAGIYNPDVTSFLGVLLFLALWNTVQHERSAFVFWVPIFLLLLPQFHMVGLVLIPAVLLVLWWSPRRLNWPALGAGILAALCLYIPYVRGEMAHDWQNSRGMVSSGGGAGYTLESLKAITSPLSFLVNWGPRWARSAADYRELGRSCFGSFGVLIVINMISAIVAGFLIVGAFLEIKEKAAGLWRSPRAAFARLPGIVFLCVLFFVPLVLATISGKPFHTRYCVVLLPLLFPLIAPGVIRWLNRRTAIGRVFLVSLVITCFANVWLVAAMSRAQGKRIEQADFFIPSFRQLETVYQRLKTHAGTNSAIEVSTTAFVSNLIPAEKELHDAVLIRRYIAIRERENESRSDGVMRNYELRRAKDSDASDPAVAYRAHGIALVSTPPPAP